MPLSDWQPLPLVTTGDMWTAAQHNTYIRNNQQALYDGVTQHADRHAAGGGDPVTIAPSQVSPQIGEATVADMARDWNTVTDPGVYPVLLHGGAPNGPGLSKFMYCMVFNYGNGTALTQIAWPYSAGDTIDVAGLWVRGYASGVWSPWRLYGGWTQTITNANGTAVRFPDGTQICWVDSVSVGTSGYVWTYPAAFIDANISVQVTMRDTTSLTATGATGITATSATLRHSAANVRSLTAVAVGRWY